MRTRIFLTIGITGMMFFFHQMSFADVPAPPVNQNIGIADVPFGVFLEPDCRVCHNSGLPDRHHLTVGQPIPPGSLVPFPDANGNGIPDTDYSCESCHGPGFIPETSMVYRDCTLCHNTSSPHHETILAQARNCTACHGDLVDDFDDGHRIPAYEPSLVTPWGSNKPTGGEPKNSYGMSAGNCNYCHDQDGQNPSTITTNVSLHHETGLGSDSTKCSWCHDFTLSSGKGIRKCQDCHGFESLHKIQSDSPHPLNIGTIVIGGEDAGYGHVGRDAGPNDSDCWGCHGSSGAFVPSPTQHPNYHHAFYGRKIPLPTDAPFGNPGEMYVCFSCHSVNFTVERDCTVCHQSIIPELDYFYWNLFLPAINKNAVP